jgi:hypothetical protein
LYIICCNFDIWAANNIFCDEMAVMINVLTISMG